MLKLKRIKISSVSQSTVTFKKGTFLRHSHTRISVDLCGVENVELREDQRPLLLIGCKSGQVNKLFKTHALELILGHFEVKA